MSKLAIVTLLVVAWTLLSSGLVPPSAAADVEVESKPNDPITVQDEKPREEEHSTSLKSESHTQDGDGRHTMNVNAPVVKVKAPVVKVNAPIIETDGGSNGPDMDTQNPSLVSEIRAEHEPPADDTPEVTTHEPEMTPADVAGDASAIGVNVGFDAIMNLSDNEAPKEVKDGIRIIGRWSTALHSLIKKALAALKPSATGERLRPGIDMLIKFIETLQRLVKHATGGPLARIKGEIVKALDTVHKFLLEGKGRLGGIITATIVKLTRVANLMAGQVAAFANFLVGGLQKIVNLVQSTIAFKFTNTGQIIVAIIKQLMKMITGGHGPLTDAMQNVLEQSQGKEIDFLGGLRSMIAFATKETNPLLSHLVNFLSTIGPILGPVVTQILGSVFSVVRGLTLSG